MAHSESFKARKQYFESHFSNIPTLDDIRDATADSIADTIRQVLTGQAIYYGYEVVWEPDNSIPAIKSTIESYAKMEVQVEKRRVKKAKKSLEEKINDFFGGKLTLAELAEKKKALGL